MALQGDQVYYDIETFLDHFKHKYLVFFILILCVTSLYSHLTELVCFLMCLYLYLSLFS